MVEPTVEVKVKSNSRKGPRYNKRLPSIAKGVTNYTTMAQKDRLGEPRVAQAANYNGEASSPHIKPEYIHARMGSPASRMRANAARPNVFDIPMVLGQTLLNG